MLYISDILEHVNNGFQMNKEILIFGQNKTKNMSISLVQLPSIFKWKQKIAEPIVLILGLSLNKRGHYSICDNFHI